MAGSDPRLSWKTLSKANDQSVLNFDGFRRTHAIIANEPWNTIKLTNFEQGTSIISLPQWLYAFQIDHSHHGYHLLLPKSGKKGNQNIRCCDSTLDQSKILKTTKFRDQTSENRNNIEESVYIKWRWCGFWYTSSVDGMCIPQKEEKNLLHREICTPQKIIDSVLH